MVLHTVTGGCASPRHALSSPLGRHVLLARQIVASRLQHMLGPGDRVPDVRVWTAPREDARSLKEVLGAGPSLLCFYVFDWSPT